MENEETTPQSGRARDIYIMEIAVTYIALVEKVERKKREYASIGKSTLLVQLQYPVYENIPLRRLSYDEVMKASYTDIVIALAEGDVPEKEKQAELVRQAGFDPVLIEKYYCKCIQGAEC